MSFLNNFYFKLFLQIGLTFTGFALLALQLKMQYFDMSGNPWNTRLYGMLGSALISIGVSITSMDVLKGTKKIVITLSVMIISWVIVGGFFVLNDVSTESNYTGNSNIWYAFDMLGTDFNIITNDFIKDLIFIIIVIGSIIGVLITYNMYKTPESTISLIVFIISVVIIIVFYFAFL